MDRLAQISGQRARRRRGTLVRFGVFLVVTAALTAFIGTQIARVGFGGGYRLTATFDDASGLLEGDQVKIAGAPVGRVEGISVVNGRARVELKVREGIRLPADSEAAIRWRNAIGQRVVYLIPGTGTQTMRPGAHITRTRSVVDIGELVNQIAPLTRSLDPRQINVLLTSIAQTLEGNEAGVTQLVRNVDQLASTIAARRQTLRQMLADYATVTGVLARREQQIARMVDNLVTLTGAFTRNRRLVEEALVQLSATVATTDRVVGRNADEIARILERATLLSGGARRNVGLLQALFTELTPKLQRAFAAVNDGRYVAGAVSCVSLDPAPCPWPQRLPGSQEGSGRIDDRSELRRLLVGGR